MESVPHIWDMENNKTTITMNSFLITRQFGVMLHQGASVEQAAKQTFEELQRHGYLVTRGMQGPLRYQAKHNVCERDYT